MRNCQLVALFSLWTEQCLHAATHTHTQVRYSKWATTVITVGCKHCRSHSSQMSCNKSSSTNTFSSSARFQVRFWRRYRPITPRQSVPPTHKLTTEYSEKVSGVLVRWGKCLESPPAPSDADIRYNNVTITCAMWLSMSVSCEYVTAAYFSDASFRRHLKTVLFAQQRRHHSV